MKISSLLDKGIRVRDITEPLSIEDNSIEVFTLRTMKFFSADIELRRIRERTRMGMRQAHQQGIWVHKAPYGYINKRNEKNKPVLEIDPVAGEKVRDLFGLVLQGLGLEQARKAAGVTQKGNSAVKRILTQSLYCGLIQHEGKFIDGNHEPLISRETYFAVQAKLSPRKLQPVQGSDIAFLKGMVYCTCGQRLTSANPRSHTGKIYWYYHCKTCQLNFPMKELHDKINDIFAEIELTDDEIQATRQTTIKGIKEYLSAHTGNIDQLSKKLQTVEKQLTTAQKKYLTTENITSDAFAAIVSELQTQKDELQIS